MNTSLLEVGLYEFLINMSVHTDGYILTTRRAEPAFGIWGDKFPPPPIFIFFSFFS
jgi:hypothetical protein